VAGHRRNKPIDHDLLRSENIDENQALLISGFLRHAPKEGLIILDGHVIIDTPSGLIEISPSVFLAIGVSRFLVLIDRIENIVSRRSLDAQRKRPKRTAAELAEQQEKSVLAAYRAALTLGIPLHILPLSDDPDISVFLG
jgi:adenylate kinase